MHGREDLADEHPVRHLTNGSMPPGDRGEVIRAGQCSTFHAIKYVYANSILGFYFLQSKESLVQFFAKQGKL